MGYFKLKQFCCFLKNVKNKNSQRKKSNFEVNRFKISRKLKKLSLCNIFSNPLIKLSILEVSKVYTN